MCQINESYLPDTTDNCSLWDEYNSCCMVGRVEKIFPEVWERERYIVSDVREASAHD